MPDSVRDLLLCKAVAESAVSGLRARCRTALQQPPAVDPGKKLAAAQRPRMCSKLRIPRGSPRVHSQLIAVWPHCRHVCKSQHMAVRSAHRANSAAETASAAKLRLAAGKPLQTAAACRVGLQTCLLRKRAQLLCKKLLPRLQTLRRQILWPCSKAANSSGKPLLASTACSLSGLVCQRCRILLQTISFF